MNNVKIGIIGTGVGIRTHLNGFRLCPDADIVAICGSSKSRSEEFAKKYDIPIACKDYKELCDIPDIDLVCVTSPNRYHMEATLYAIEKGKHIICEKPLSDKYSEVIELSNIAENYNKIAVVDHQLRYNPYINKIKQLIDSGEIGRVYSVILHQQAGGFAGATDNWCWSFDGKQGGGVRLAMASHFTDLIQYWFNDRDVVSVNGFMSPVTRERSDKAGNTYSIDASTICAAHINFTGELCAQYYINAGAYSGSRFDIIIFGDKGELHYSLDTKLAIYKRCELGKRIEVEVDDVYQDERENKISIFSGSFRYFAPLIVKAIQTKDYELISKSATFKDAVYNLTILEAIKQAANRGEGVAIGKETNHYV